MCRGTRRVKGPAFVDEQTSFYVGPEVGTWVCERKHVCSEWVVVVSRSFLEISKDMYAVAMPSRKPDTAYIVVDLERLPMCGRFSDFYRSLARLCLWMRGTGPDHRRVGPQWSP